MEIGNRLEVGNNRREEKLCKHEKLWSMGNYGSRFEVNGIITRKAGNRFEVKGIIMRKAENRVEAGGERKYGIIMKFRGMKFPGISRHNALETIPSERRPSERMANIDYAIRKKTSRVHGQVWFRRIYFG